MRRAIIQDIGQLDQLFRDLTTEMQDLQPLIYQKNALPEPNYFQHYLNSDQAILLVSTNQKNQAVGFSLTFMAHTPDNPIFVPHQFAYLADIYLAPAFRQQGRATELLQQSLTWAKIRQADYLQLDTAANNAAQKLYAKFGFQQTSLTWQKLF